MFCYNKCGLLINSTLLNAVIWMLSKMGANFRHMHTLLKESSTILRWMLTIASKQRACVSNEGWLWRIDLCQTRLDPTRNEIQWPPIRLNCLCKPPHRALQDRFSIDRKSWGALSPLAFFFFFTLHRFDRNTSASMLDTLPRCTIMGGYFLLKWNAHTQSPTDPCPQVCKRLLTFENKIPLFWAVWKVEPTERERESEKKKKHDSVQKSRSKCWWMGDRQTDTHTHTRASLAAAA